MARKHQSLGYFKDEQKSPSDWGAEEGIKIDLTSNQENEGPIFRTREAQQKIRFVGRVMMRLISFLLDILSKVSVGYSSEKKNHESQTGKGDLKLGEGGRGLPSSRVRHPSAAP